MTRVFNISLVTSTFLLTSCAIEDINDTIDDVFYPRPAYSSYQSSPTGRLYYQPVPQWNFNSPIESETIQLAQELEEFAEEHRDAGTRLDRAQADEIDNRLIKHQFRVHQSSDEISTSAIDRLREAASAIRQFYPPTQ